VVSRRTERRPIVEVRATVPGAVPGTIDGLAELVGHAVITFRPFVLVSARGQRRHPPQQIREEPAEPDAFAFPLDADMAVAVVPVRRSDEWKPVSAELEADVDSTSAVLE